MKKNMRYTAYIYTGYTYQVGSPINGEPTGKPIPEVLKTLKGDDINTLRDDAKALLNSVKHGNNARIDIYDTEEVRPVPILSVTMKGRPPKDAETRKAVTLRITPTAAAILAKAAEAAGCSQSDILEDYLIGCLGHRVGDPLYSGRKVPDWADRSKK